MADTLYEVPEKQQHALELVHERLVLESKILEALRARAEEARRAAEAHEARMNVGYFNSLKRIIEEAGLDSVPDGATVIGDTSEMTIMVKTQE